MPAPKAGALPRAARTLNTWPASRPQRLYARIWRWHFFAGLLCTPVLVCLAITGSLYLFQSEINDWLYPEQRFFEIGTTPARPVDALVADTVLMYPGEVVQIQTPAQPDRSWQMTVAQPRGTRVLVWVDPYTGRTLGARAESRQWELVVRQLHSLALLGEWANWVVETVAGWTLVLGFTGLYLWWPRRWREARLRLRGTPRQRIWWRDAHATIGVLGGGLVLFLVLTGMPWSAVWGTQFAQLTRALGVGMPESVWAKVPQSDVPMHAQGEVPWTLETATLPVSDQQGISAAMVPIGLGGAAQRFDAAGLTSGYVLRAPWGPAGVYTAMHFPADVREQRVVHLDQYSGRTLIDTGYPQYGSVAKAVEWGTSLHQGRQLGLPNQLIMLVGCVAVLALAVTGLVMWWKRRPAGKFAAPARRRDLTVSKKVVAITVALGVLFPLLGASLLTVMLLDWLAHRLWPTRWD